MYQQTAGVLKENADNLHY